MSTTETRCLWNRNGPRPKPNAHPFNPAERFERVRGEARATLATLGVHSVVFGDLPTVTCPQGPIGQVNGAVQHLIAAHAPELLHIPFPFDLHGDHPALFNAVDSGDILEQVPFTVGPRMAVSDVSQACQRTLHEGLRRLLPRLARSANQVYVLIRASAPPHPGAYCYSNGRRLRILSSEGEIAGSTYSGVPGKVLRRDGDTYDVQCDPGVVRIRQVVDEDGQPVELRDGTLLRTAVEDELHSLRSRVAELERITARLLERG